ncbi:hypothetical protein Aph01nite_11780 [Acrocarpospora phusangensis]|uniref:Uncharacterized protein n=1 Tax=Acrocarpospora phusangensis TaxID=1070424 RepID=A0A919Q6K6_9ACTN|nr:hypothetical protein [Acrocarpospora phusangensis]GIH22868.1 hypothetical protein Aph01nite_11780 [Acrocarpospora phusangensis]
MMIALCIAAMAIAPIGVGDSGDSPNRNSSGDTANTGNSRNSGNHIGYRAVNSGNFLNTNGSTNSGNSSYSLNYSNGTLRITVNKCRLRRHC